MQKRQITYIVTTQIEFGDIGDWKRKVRDVRTEFKKAINAHKGMKVLKIQVEA